VPVVVRVLGPLEVVCDGRPVVVQGGKERRLLVSLALQAGSFVSSDRLIEALWDGPPPASAAASLRVLVSRVRKALTAAGTHQLIETGPGGYRLIADHVDSAQFEELATRGRRELTDGQFDAASATLTRALQLWRNEQLPEVGTRYLQDESERFAELKLTVLEARITADLARGRHADAVGELAMLCPAHPLREDLWGQWITALYRCGRQADALQAMRDLRSALAENLGIDPSPALRALEAMVLSQDPELLAPKPPQAAVRQALPAALDIGERVALAGRDVELQMLTAAWTDACLGKSGTALVSGDAGIGKSRLLRELARSVGNGAGVVLHGRCDPELAIPCQPFVTCLAEALAASPDQVLTDVGPRKLGELARIVPDVLQRQPDLPAPLKADPDVERYLLFGAAASLLSALARTGPVLIVLDDLHWADRTTLQLMTHLTGLNLGSLLIVGAHRDSERADGPLVEMLSTLHRNAAATRVTLRGLTPEQGQTVMATIVGSEPDDTAVDLVHRVHGETQGNPFYLTELLRHLLETDVITRLPDGRCTVRAAPNPADLPNSIREVLRARLARLGEQAASALSVAAVIGPEFDTDLLATASAPDEDSLLDLLEAAQRAALIQPDHTAGRYRFAHVLVQHTLYVDLSPARRTRAHARVAAGMETLGGHEPGELAHHYLAGMTAATTDKAVHYARAAGEHALAVSAPNEAARWYSAALNALPPPRDDIRHARVQLDLGIAQRQADDAGYRETLLSAAHTAHRFGADDLLVDAAIAVHPGGFSILGQIDSEKVTILETALEVAAPNTPKRARLLAALSGELTWHPDHHRRIALANEAVSVARRSGDDLALYEAISYPGPANWVPETSEERVRLCREALRLADRANDPVARIDAVGMLAPYLLEQGAADRCESDLDSAAEVASEFREPLFRTMLQLTRCSLTIVRGDLELAERQAGELLSSAPDNVDAQEGHSELIGIIRWHQGRLSEALPHLRAALNRLPSLPSRWAEVAFAEAVGGDPDVAKHLLNDAAENDFDIFYGPIWLGCLCTWAAVAAEVGDTRAAAVLYSKLAPWPDLFGTTGPIPVHGVSHALGRLAALAGDFNSAVRHFELASKIHHRMGAPFYAAETALYHGGTLIETQPDRARTLLTDALQIARRQGYGDVERRAARALLS